MGFPPEVNWELPPSQVDQLALPELEVQEEVDHHNIGVDECSYVEDQIVDIPGLVLGQVQAAEFRMH